MKKILISAIFILGFGSYVAYSYASANSSQSVAIATTTSTNTMAALPTNSVPVTVIQPSVPIARLPVKSVPATPTTPVSQGHYKNGTYTGSVVNGYYGDIQVQAVISSGKLSNVVFLKYPSDRDESVSINQRAMPILKSEAIKAQSSNVSGVTGASDSSTSFNQSLASALAKAAV
jgi:uncharacterized protein with FMN-binding domain